MSFLFPLPLKIGNSRRSLKDTKSAGTESGKRPKGREIPRKQRWAAQGRLGGGGE